MPSCLTAAKEAKMVYLGQFCFGIVGISFLSQCGNLPGIHGLPPALAAPRRHSNFNCTAEFGNFPDPYSCEAYWICSNGQALAASCSFGLIYSHKTMNCDWAKPELCTMVDGKVVRDWAPATPPPLLASEQAKMDKMVNALDQGFNQGMKIDFMTVDTGDTDNAITKQVQLLLNISRKGTPKTVFEQYQLLVAKWKKQQKVLQAMGYTTTAAPVLTTREAPLWAPNDYILPESVTAAPRKAYTLKPVGESPLSCTDKRCRLPECYCDAAHIPGSLSAEETPQIIMLTFDDAVNGGNIDMLNLLFNPARLNPNGCPVTGTFFLANQWTDYKLVKNMSQKGHEIASHSMAHQDMTHYTYQQWRNEIVGEVELAGQYAGLNKSNIVGMRAPFLAIGGDTQLKMLWDNGFLYDSSIPSSQTNPPLWPYTFDATMPHACFQEPCPKGYFPGLWEVPLTFFVGMNNMGCSMYDACTFPSYPEEIADLVWTNFMKHYSTNRAPFLLSSHSAWYLNSNQRAEGMRQFMDRALKLGDVYFVSVHQALKWVQHPRPLAQLGDFEPWKCNNPTVTPTPPVATGTAPPKGHPVPAAQSVVAVPQSATTNTTTTTTSTSKKSTATQMVLSTKASATKSSVTLSTRRSRRRRSRRTTSTAISTTTSSLVTPAGGSFVESEDLGE